MPDETMSEKIARLKTEGAGTSDPAAIEGAKGTLSSTSDPQGVNDGKADPNAQPAGESGGAVRGSDGSGAATTKSGDAVARELDIKSATVTDGTKDGERIRARSESLIPESNDVMLGDQSSRLKPSEKGPLEVDGSRSPHDATSEGGSRQADALQQVGAAGDAAAKARENPAFQAEAKARTI